MEPIITTGRVEGGTLHLRNRKWVEKRLKQLRDCDVTVTIERLHATRSLAQNSWYWSVVLKRISDHTGYSVDELHEWAKAKFLPKRRAMCSGNGEVVDEYVIGGSTTRLNKVEFGEYVESIRQWAAEKLELDIPDPDVDWREEVA